jgi:hypothetical protein
MSCADANFRGAVGTPRPTTFTRSSSGLHFAKNSDGGRFALFSEPGTAIIAWPVNKQPPTIQNPSPVEQPKQRKPAKAVTTAKAPEISHKRILLQNLFAIDLRSLALFRVLLALLLLIDLAIRVTDLKAMYTDDGMFPRAEILQRITTVWNWSFHFASGAASYQAILFGIAGIFALAVAAGFATRIATIGSWLMLVSIHHRVPAVLSGAEILLRMLLFWAMFLPLGAAWSVDGWRAKRKGKVTAHPGAFVLSIGSAAILLQVALMYLFSAIFKSNGQWFHGQALSGILSHDFFASPPAASLLRFPTLLKYLTWTTLGLEWAALFLLFSPRWTGRIRLATICALSAMHIGIGICLEVGLFSYVSIAGLSLFLPAAFWNSRLFARFRSRDANIPVGAPRDLRNQAATKKQSPLAYAIQGFAVLAFVYIVALNINSFSTHPLASLDPEDFRFMRTGLGLSQNWGMFGEVPSMDGWYVARAKLRDGSLVDLLRHGAALDWKRPAVPARIYPNYYWHKLFREMAYFDDQGFQVWRAPVAQYLCRNWNARNPAAKEVADFEFIFCIIEKERAANTGPPRLYRRQLVRLDFLPGHDQPLVSGYTDAPKSGSGSGTP